ncbi:hypothetical protein KSP40_PGU017135 [Platanthera guangdongensis]|uniref:DUF4005 domain-containing protein n=1 Tax=Platanthera guangdongensis TaxID=2320717 RepID=A0ABR2N3N7_9ASPA
MTATESARAIFRPQSAPRQRPVTPRVVGGGAGGRRRCRRMTTGVFRIGKGGRSSQRKLFRENRDGGAWFAPIRF